jgi:phosphoglycerol transferase MdoB-like AlkP superfamily enzyme
LFYGGIDNSDTLLHKEIESKIGENRTPERLGEMKHKLRFKLAWKSRKSIAIYLLFIYFIFIVTTYYQQEEKENSSLAVLIMLWIITSFLPMIEFTVVTRVLKKYATWINGLVLILSPIASFFMVEIMVSNFNFDMFKKYSFYNIIWYFVIYYLVFALIRNSKLTVMIGNLVIYLASFVNYFVYLFRGNPILPSDLLAWQTGMSVASHYEIQFTKGFITASLIMLIVFVLGMKLEHTGRNLSLINRMLGLGVYGVFSVAIFGVFFQTDLIESKIRVLDFFAPKYTYCSYGTAFGFVANVQAMETDQPKGYTIKRVKEVYEQFKTPDKTNKTAIKPNIIAIMNEAYSDISMVGDFTTDKAYFPYTSTLKDNTTKGTLYVSVFGGATSDTEYEFLTGNSMAVMPPNSVPYQQFITEPTDSLASTLKKQGYYNIAIHPYEASGYKRDMVYPLLGFDEFISEEDFIKPTKIRTFISDRESYRKIIEEYEKAEKTNPVFIFNVTMQNHGGYSDSRLFDESETVRLTNLEGHEPVEQYLSLLRETDKAFEILVDYFSSISEPTIILLFGDHQPVAYAGIHDQFDKEGILSTYEQAQRKYRVPFMVWANYDITEDDVDNISANYLSSYLLKTAGLKGSPYHRYLFDLYQQIPVVNGMFYMDKSGQCYTFGENSPYSELIQTYRIVGYNNALDRKSRWKKMYRIK